MTTTTIPEKLSYAQRLARTRVERGIEALDVGPLNNWRDWVEPDTLDMSSPTGCVLGQIYGEYSIGLGALGLNKREGANHGFDSSPLVPYSLLREAWLEALS